MKIRNGIVINGDIYGLVEYPGGYYDPDECGSCALFDICVGVFPREVLPCLMFNDAVLHSNFKRFRINHDGEQIIAPLIDYTFNGLIFDSVFYELQPTRSRCKATCDLRDVCQGMGGEFCLCDICDMFHLADNARMVFKMTNYDIFEYDVFEEIEER